MLRTTVLAASLLALSLVAHPVGAQVKKKKTPTPPPAPKEKPEPVLPPEKKVDKITKKNIEAGVVGKIDRLTVVRAASDEDFLVCRFDGLKVVVNKWKKPVGVGKELPADQLWRCMGVSGDDLTGSGLSQVYILEPVVPKDGELKAEPKKK